MVVADSISERPGGDGRPGLPAAGVWAVVVAAGSGHRFGGAKQFQPLGDRCVLDWAVQGAARWAQGVVVVLPEAKATGPDAWLRSSPVSSGAAAGAALSGADAGVASVGRGSGGVVVAVPGGVTRSDSVRCGLNVVPGEAEIVLVHDGARPLADDGVFERVIQAVRGGADAAVPVVELTDTIRQRGKGTIDRRELLAVQTPQAFRAGALRAAHADAADATDDATLVESCGGTVATVPGDSRNLKITEPHDLATAEALLAAGVQVGGEVGGAGGPAGGGG